MTVAAFFLPTSRTGRGHSVPAHSLWRECLLNGNLTILSTNFLYAHVLTLYNSLELNALYRGCVCLLVHQALVLCQQWEG